MDHVFGVYNENIINICFSVPSFKYKTVVNLHHDILVNNKGGLITKVKSNAKNLKMTVVIKKRIKTIWSCKKYSLGLT